MGHFLHQEYDAIIIGGGFYGCSLALALAPRLPRILILDRESDILLRASYANQARVHNGYHYPRSLLTAMRSAVNYPHFTNEFRDCIDRSFLHVYAIARCGSKVTAYQFRKFCQQVGIPLGKPPSSIAKLFNPALIEDVFSTEECAFDAVKLRAHMRDKLAALDIEVACECEVVRVSQTPSQFVRVGLEDGRELSAPYVFNCTYSQINQLLGQSSLPKLPLKHEVAELALIKMPPVLENVGVTVMDGPYFSTIPFPSLGLHTLSHVTYTPHQSWSDSGDAPPPAKVLHRSSKSIFMMKDAQRYLPVLQEASYIESLFETKTVLLRNEVDDGRPILCSRNYGGKGFFVILGAKIDNIYDIVRTIECEPFSSRSTLCQLQSTH
ncbi:MAG: FAD-binding oxidoreductase [Acidobacteriota bacterium]|nr:FAD-binding oxidoreductase [Acidobacteriota bacterium]